MLRYDSIWIIYNANGIFFNFAYYYRLIMALIGAEDLCKMKYCLNSRYYGVKFIVGYSGCCTFFHPTSYPTNFFGIV